MTWYCNQNMRVWWNETLSSIFVINGVCQGGVFSPVLFAVYIDELLLQLKQLGVGCHWKHHFVDAVCYADDLDLLAPSQTALRLMLCLCKQSHGLIFHPSKTYSLWVTAIYLLFYCILIMWHLNPFPINSIIHLGHILQYDLDDDMIFFRPLGILFAGRTAYYKHLLESIHLWRLSLFMRFAYLYVICLHGNSSVRPSAL